MKELNFEQMEEVNGGGCSTSANRFISSVGLVAGVASMFGPVGLMIAGPTALGMGILSAYCAFSY